ncbi:MAG: efflux RND transporter periplasmic adaptor subunit [Sedimentisphaerales bacterium]|nr:efflux RND transporter periplasmic adaptor subunit [Sedimentisphaerales bacterium]
MVKKDTGENPIPKSDKAKNVRIVLMIMILPVIITTVFGFKHFRHKKTNSYSNIELYTVKRGDLTISVIESGSIKSVKQVTIESSVEYRTTIVNIVPEGTTITQEDVNNGMVLIEMDSSELMDRLPQMEIDVASAETSFTEAKEKYDIQLKQNESDLNSARMKVKFALMDLQKYVGEDASQKILDQIKQNPSADIDMQVILEEITDSNTLCEASQKMLETTSNITMSHENLEKAKYNLEGKQKLFNHDYASENELNESRLQVKRQELDIEKIEISFDLFKKFEFPKQVEQLLSNYREAELGLERAESSARSNMSQAEVRRTSSESSLKTRKERLEKLKEQIAACTIKAPSPGQVVYYSSLERYVSFEIEQGSEVPRGYPLIVIPDTTKMKVEINVPETWINKIQVNQPAQIIVTAFPENVLTGKVLKKSPLANSQSSSLLADVKVYTTDVSIEGQHDFLRTGMTAKVEIIIDKLKNIIYVPIQSVIAEEGNKTRVCYLMTPHGPEKRIVRIGLFNDNFVEIKEGLDEGEKVLYAPPRWSEKELQEETESAGESETQKQDEPNEPAMPANPVEPAGQENSETEEIQKIIQKAIMEKSTSIEKGQ